MKRMFTLNRKSRSRWMLLLLLLVAGVTNTLAQNVTVHPDNGSMMPALKSGNTDTFYGWGGFATWKHEQLSLTMTTGDSDNNLTDESNQLTSSGQLAKPANDIFATEGATLNYITFVSGGTTYYLNLNNNNQPRFTTEKTTIWEVDDDGYVHSGNTYLACSSSGNPRTLTTGNQRRLQINNNGRLYCNISSGWGYTTYYLHGTTSATTTPTLTTDNSTGLAVWDEETEWTGTRYLQIGKGGVNSYAFNTYLTICLPKGYRFTGYTIKFHRISAPAGRSAGSVNNYNGGIAFGETDNTFTYTSTANTTDDNITTYRGGIDQNNTTIYTISRTSDTDMDNVLYFKLGTEPAVAYRAFIQLDLVELYFTAEHNTPTLIPAQTATEVSAVDIPFSTSKIDYGQLIMRDIDGNAQGSYGYNESTARMSYDGTLRDMNANMILYEKGSVETVSDNGFDGTGGDIVKYYPSGHSISSAGDYFKLESSKHPQFEDDGEAIYYIESPIWAENTSAGVNAHKNPIGYRIVSAKFNYGPGSGEVHLPAIFKIEYESINHGPNEDGTYGLNVYSGTYNWNYHTPWRIDQEGYIYGYNTNGDGTIYYLAYGVDNQGNNNFIMTTTKPTTANGTFEITENKQIRLKSNTDLYLGWKETVDGTYVDDNHQTNDNVTRYFVIAEDEAHRATYNEMSPATTGTHGDYVLKIYGPDGETVARTINVGETGGSETVYGYNNDAIKIGVVGTALINAEVTMQALDPYIDRLDIVCQESGGTGGKLTQQFSATDFAVKGGKFTFYVPEGFPAPAKFTFENLYSHYGDDTYYGNTSSTNHARYFFVKSQYEQTAANVYDRNNEDSYTTKVKTEQTGDKKFTFNNASTVGSAGGYFEEYAFTPSIYTKSTTQGGAGGTFADFTFSQTEMNNSTIKTAYLFTCDEPRYNIAPTTATQHVYYAFYEMKIDMQTKTYQPTLTWEKLYDNTFYSANNTNIKRDSKWGLKLTTTETIDDHGTHSGYLTVSQILDKIDKRTGGNTVEGGPENTDQILYIDGSKLMSIVENQTSTGTGSNVTYTSHPKSELKAELDQNALIYLPYGSKSSDDNFAFNTIEDYTKTPIFRGANNIVIQDRYPFYAPYDIQVDAAKMAKYERSVTNQDLYGDDDQHLTIVLPFEIDVNSSGVHTNEDGQGSSFSLATMKEENALSKKTGSMINFYKDGADGYFETISGKSEANKPYVVTLQGSAGESAFKVHVKGSLVKATPNKTGIFEGEGASGTYTYKDGDVNKTVNYTFTHKGTYTGIEIGEDGKGGAATASTTVFYFANNLFLDSKSLANAKSLKMLPYRSYYDYTGTGAGAKMMQFRIVFGENEENNTTGINEVQKNSNLAIIPGNGSITIMAKADTDVAIHTVNGMAVEKCNLRAGETRTVAMPSGIYVINGVKMVVK